MSKQRVKNQREVIRRSLESRKQPVVHHLAKRFYQILYEGRSVPEASSDVSEWIPIESLSQLRSHVGGRFQNLKQRWVAAGFPLREHRGDRSDQAEVNEGEWLELSAWIAKQGYESRLVHDETVDAVIELRKVSSELG